MAKNKGRIIVKELAHEYEFITNGVKDEYLSKELQRYMNMTDEELEKEEKQINANSPDA